MPEQNSREPSEPSIPYNVLYKSLSQNIIKFLDLYKQGALFMQDRHDANRVIRYNPSLYMEQSALMAINSTIADEGDHLEKLTMRSTERVPLKALAIALVELKKEHISHDIQADMDADKAKLIEQENAENGTSFSLIEASIKAALKTTSYTARFEQMLREATSSQDRFL